jgi:uncharacterized protein YrrD
LRKSQEVIGLSVIHLKTGEKLGTVTDLLFDRDQRWRGVVLQEGGFFKRRKYIRSDNIVSIGKDAVMVDSDQVILPFDRNAEEWISIYNGENKLKGRPLLTAGGYEMGMVENVYFMEEVGTLIGYELSGGLISDLAEGRKVVKTTHPLTWGKDVLIAPHDRIEVKDARI